VARTRLTLLAAFAAWLSASASARAGEAACWFEGGVVVVPAQVAGIAGDFILDTGAPRTLLHETKAQAEGIEATELSGPVRLAGLALPARPVGVADLDVRTWNLPTAVAGVIGADVLRDFVVDVSFRPCRVRLSRPGEAPPFRASRVLPLAWDGGRPTAQARVSDGARTLRGAFVVATGANVAVRLADDLASVPTARPLQGSDADELYPNGRWLAELGSLRFAGRTERRLGAGLMPPEGDAAGVIGGPALARFRLRFDFPAGRLSVATAPRSR
jgi:hypothetical protein